MSKTKIDKEIEKEKEKYAKLSELLKDLKDTKDLTVKEAILLGEKRISYCKGKDLVQVIRNNYLWLKETIQNIANIDIGPEPNQNSFQKIFEVFFKFKLLLKLNRMEGDTLKYPKRLFPPKKEEDIASFDELKFYWINIHSEVSRKNMVYLSFSIIGVLLICMFPIWPLKVKIGVWWVVFITLIALLFLTILSLIVVIVGVIFGYDIFILPNVLETKQPWKERLFNPLVAYFPREDPCYLVFLRINMGLAIVILCVVAWYYPSFFVAGFTMIGNWGTSLYTYIQTKIVTQHNNKSSSSISMIERQNKIIEDIE